MTVRILHGDCRDTLKTLANESVHCCVTSPPYFGLRDYGNAAQIGLEATPDEFIAKLVEVFREVRRVLRDDGTLWVNMGDSYGHGTSAKRERSKTSTKLSVEAHEAQGARHGGVAKQLLGVPWKLAFALQADGWILRQDIIWSKPNPMPESVRDRCTKAHEYLFLLSKSPRYHCDMEAISEEVAPATVERLSQPTLDEQQGADRVPGKTNGRMKAVGAAYSFARKTATTPPPGQPTQHREGREDVAYFGRRNKRSVWTVATQPFSEAHFATFPPELIEPCILAGCPESGTVLDPFGGAGTTGLVADRFQRSAILCELNPEYIGIAERRITGDAPLFTEVASA